MRDLPEMRQAGGNCKNRAVCTTAARAVVINNTNTNAVYANPYAYGRAKNKWIAFFLCLFLGILGAHKFYEGKVGMGILYLFTGGLFVIGVIVDLIAILGKPRLYY